MTFKYLKQLSFLDIAFHIMANIIILLAIVKGQYEYNVQSTIAIVLFSFMGLLFSIFQLKQFLFFFLAGLFIDLVCMRICALTNLPLSTEFYFLILMSKVFQFFYIAHYNIKYENNPRIIKISSSIWQLIFLRIYIGLNLLFHCIDKLFLGNEGRVTILESFTAMGFVNPLSVVIFSGILEFLFSIGITLGLFTPIVTLGSSIYLLASTILNSHFQAGFLWTNPGDGYEFPLMWIILTFTFFITGSQQFSLDCLIKSKLDLVYKRKYKNIIIRSIYSIIK